MTFMWMSDGVAVRIGGYPSMQVFSIFQFKYQTPSYEQLKENIITYLRKKLQFKLKIFLRDYKNQ